MCRSRLRCCAGLSDWSNRISLAPVSSASALISSALPLPTNSAASGALRLAVTRATGSMPAVWASWPSSSSSASKWGRPRSTPTRMVAAAGRSDDAVKPATRKNEGTARGGGPGDGAASGGGAFPVFGRREVHRPARDDGGDRMLVDHLRDGIAQQHHVLVERLDLPLQLDAVDEIDG